MKLRVCAEGSDQVEAVDIGEIKEWTDELSRTLAAAVGLSLPCSFFLDGGEVPQSLVGFLCLAQVESRGLHLEVRPDRASSPAPAADWSAWGYGAAPPPHESSDAGEGTIVAANLDCVGYSPHAYGSDRESDRASSTVRSDYAEDSGDDAFDEVEIMHPSDDDERPIDLPKGGLLAMVANRTLPTSRLRIPNRVCKSQPGRYATMIKWQVAAECGAQIFKERKRGNTVKLTLTTELASDGTVRDFVIRAPRPSKKSKSEWREKIGELAGCLLELQPEAPQPPPTPKGKKGEVSKSSAAEVLRDAPDTRARLVLFVKAVGDRTTKDRDRLMCDWISGSETDPLSEGTSEIKFLNLGFVRSYMNKFEAARCLDREDPPFGELLASPIIGRRRDAHVLEWEDVTPDDDDVAARGAVTVPINRQQFGAIKRIGCDKLVLIQGPPGTGKSTTIFNALKYRLPEGKQAIVAAVTNQAVGAVLEKLVMTECYHELQDCREVNGPLVDPPEGRFSFVLVCPGRVLGKLLKEARDYHIDTITRKLIDKRAEVKHLMLQFMQFSSAFTKTELEKRSRDLFFYKGGKNRSDSFRRSLRKFVLNTDKPDFQRFADAELATRNDQGEFEAEECSSFEDTRKICLTIWREHLEAVRGRHFHELKRHVLHNSDVVLCTIDSMHKQDMNDLSRSASAGRLHSIYIDEASLVPEEAMPIIALFNPVTLALIGDHCQLRPFSNLNYNLCKGEDKRYNRSFFERCMDCGLDSTMLRDNYRNPPELVNVLNIMTYENKLVAKVMKSERPNPAIEWRTHSYLEDKKEVCKDMSSDGDPSSRNCEEVRLIEKLYRKLKREGEKSILIITFYKGQYTDLKREIDVEEDDGDRICTVDSCQGTEARIVIISCVRSNLHGGVGFTGHPNRLNVAISRAKERLIIFGNKDTFLASSRRAKFKNPTWAQLHEAIENQ